MAPDAQHQDDDRERRIGRQECPEGPFDDDRVRLSQATRSHAGSQSVHRDLKSLAVIHAHEPGRLRHRVIPRDLDLIAKLEVDASRDESMTDEGGRRHELHFSIEQQG